MQLLFILWILLPTFAHGGCGPGHAFPCEGHGCFINDIDDNPPVVNGYHLFECDIKLGTFLQNSYLGGKIHDWFDKYVEPPEEDVEHDPLWLDQNMPQIHDNTRKAHIQITRRWPDGEDGFPEVPYSFDSLVDQFSIKSALEHWMEHTCIVFKPVQDKNKPHVKFIKSRGCWSYVGMLPWAGQDVSIGEGCGKMGVIAHEIGHAIGFWHEQSRGDRDQFINIHYSHISDGMARNFASYSELNFSVPYDYASDMHYSGNAFTKNGKLTITTLDHMQQALLGTRTGLSFRDIKLANKMYDCTGKWLSACDMNTDHCKNEGYIGKDCECVCPAHTSGEFCENVNGGYYDHLQNNKTEKIYKETNISAKLYGDKFVKYIRAPECQLPKLTFNGFNLTQKYGGKCKWEYLNIRKDQDLHEGDTYCGNEITPGQEIISTSQEMLLFSMSRHEGDSYWEAQLTFVQDPKCFNSTTELEPNTTTTKKSITTTTTTTTTTMNKPTTTTTTTITIETTTNSTTTTKPTTKPTTANKAATTPTKTNKQTNTNSTTTINNKLTTTTSTSTTNTNNSSTQPQITLQPNSNINIPDTIHHSTIATNTTNTTNTKHPSTFAPSLNLVSCQKLSNMKKTLKPGDTLIFNSPNFPQEYPSGVNCRLQVSSNTATGMEKREGSTRIVEWIVNCPTFHLEERNRHKCVDYLQIGHRRFFGEYGPIDYRLHSSTLFIGFRSNNLNNYPGFLCTITSR